MAFRIEKKRRFWWPVSVNLPRDGKTVTHTFRAEFELLDDDRMDEIIERVRAEIPENTEQLSAALDMAIINRNSHRMILREAWIGWADDLQDEDKNPLPYSEEQRDDLLKIELVRRAVWEAYEKARSGKAASKN